MRSLLDSLATIVIVLLLSLKYATALQVRTNLHRLEYAFPSKIVGLFFAAINLDDPRSRLQLLRVLRHSNANIRLDYADSNPGEEFCEKLLRHFYPSLSMHSYMIPFEFVAGCEIVAKKVLTNLSNYNPRRYSG